MTRRRITKDEVLARITEEDQELRRKLAEHLKVSKAEHGEGAVNAALQEGWRAIAENQVARAREGNRRAKQAVLRRFAADKQNADPLVIEYAAEVMQRLLDPDADPSIVKRYRETPTETRDKAILRARSPGLKLKQIAELLFPNAGRNSLALFVSQ